MNQDYKNKIGDGQLPNKYYVFHYNQKYTNKEGCLEIIQNDKETKDAFLGEFNTFKEALACVDNKAYLPNVIIEDRLSGQVFEQMCIVCPCCNKEDYETNTDINFTKRKMEEAGHTFE